MKFRPPGVASGLVRRWLGGAGDLGLEVAETPFRGALGVVGRRRFGLLRRFERRRMPWRFWRGVVSLAALRVDASRIRVKFGCCAFSASIFGKSETILSNLRQFLDIFWIDGII